MAGDTPKSSSHKRPPPSSAQQRRSRWESSSSSSAAAAAAAAGGGNNPSSDAGKSSRPSAGESKPPTSRPPSDNNNKPTPKRNPNPNPSPAKVPTLLGPPPPPTYGFHMLDRRTIILADGSVRSYFALPPDYQDFPRFMPGGPELGRMPLMSPNGLRERDDPFGRNRGSQEYWSAHGIEGRGSGSGPGMEGSMKRKYGEGEGEGRERGGRDEYARQRLHLLQYGNAGANLGTGTSSPFGRDDEFRSSKHMRISGVGGFDNNMGMRQEIDPAVMKAFLHFVKMLNENPTQRRNYLENGKHGSLQCLACGRSSQDFPDVHSLVMHTYNSDNAALRGDHLGLHKALCVLMGWSYMRPPDNSRAYQFLPADEAAANQDDLILWPPLVIIHNSSTGKGKDGRVEGLGNKAMDSKLRDLGFSGGKSQSLYNKEGHRGVTLVKFANDQSGLKEALRLADYFEKERRGRRGWILVQSIASGRDDENNNPDLVTVDKRTGERTRVLYGYLGTVGDLEKLDFDTKKKVSVESKREKLQFQ